MPTDIQADFECYSWRWYVEGKRELTKRKMTVPLLEKESEQALPDKNVLFEFP
ncbi:uncharacterized, partial [Tachysurus ichikawai]